MFGNQNCTDHRRCNTLCRGTLFESQNYRIWGRKNGNQSPLHWHQVSAYCDHTVNNINIFLKVMFHEAILHILYMHYRQNGTQ